jgi:chemotaxis response regulator CheB
MSTTTETIRVLLVDDENIVRDGFATILRLQPDLEVVGEGHDGLEALEMAEKTRPNVILLDLQMPRQDGLTTIPLLRERVPDAAILVLTSFAETDKVYSALRSGARGTCSRIPLRAGPAGDPRCGRGASIAAGMAMKVIHEINHPVEKRSTDRSPQGTRRCSCWRGLSTRRSPMALCQRQDRSLVYAAFLPHVASRTQAALAVGGCAVRDESDEGRSQL